MRTDEESDEKFTGAVESWKKKTSIVPHFFLYLERKYFHALEYFGVRES